MYKNIIFFYSLLFFIFIICACGEELKPTVHGVFTDDSICDVNKIDLPEVQNSGELIVLTLYGPDTYF